MSFRDPQTWSILMFTWWHLLFDYFHLPWFMDLTFQVSMQSCSLQHQNLLSSPVTSTPGILLWLHLFILSGVISPLISNSILDTYWPGEFIFQCHIFLSFHGAFKARLLKSFAIPLSSGPQLVRTLTMTCASGVALHVMAHCFIELDKVLIHVINLFSFLWLWLSFFLSSDCWG